jgi:hypothetical protein
VAALQRLRPHADEVVVAVDARVDPAAVEGYTVAADRLFRFEFEDFVERALPWLHSQCTQEWVLRVDGDELASASLLEQLGEFTTARDVVQYWLPRCLLYPNERNWLREWPWWPDYQARLFRNDPLLWTPGLLHTSITPVWPARFAEGAALYHLEALVQTLEEREAKRARYAALGTASTAEWLFRRPDLHARTAPVAVPEPDADAIAQVVHARGAPVPAQNVDPPLVTRAEIDRYWPERILDPSAYRATLRVLERPGSLVAGEYACVRLVLRNDGAETWPGGEERRPLIRLGHRWLADDDQVTTDGGRTALPGPVRRGESCVLPVPVNAPAAPGSYVLEFDLVHEHVRWFGHPSRLTLAVAAPR